MYRLVLAIRYLLTRPLNLLGMAGITLSVWALIVVVSLFSGFLAVVERHVHEAGADIVVSALPAWTRWSTLAPALADDPNVAATAPRLLHYGLLLRPGHRPPPAPLPGRGALHGGDQPFLFVMGIDAAQEAQVTGFAAWVRDAEIPAELRAADVAAPLAMRDGVPTVLIGLERMQREGLRPGDAVLLTTARLVEDEAGQKHPSKVQVPLRVAGAYKTAHSGFDGNNVFVGSTQIARGGHAESGREGCSGVSGPVAIVFALGAEEEAVQSAVLADGVDLLAATGEHFVHVTLVADVEEDFVLGRIESAVQGDGELDHAEVRSEVSAGFGDGADEFVADVLGEQRQIFLGHSADVGRAVDAVEHGCLMSLRRHRTPPKLRRRPPFWR